MGFISKIKPPRGWQPAVAVLFGAIVGLTMYMAKVANVASYMTDDPQACINCHVMTTEYITWKHSSHREVASCNDCHVPHENVVKKYAFKAKDGLYHASMFTLRAEPQAIVMKEAGQEVVQNNCIRCHFNQVTDAKTVSWVASHVDDRLDRTCWECHRTVPHGRVKSLSAVGFHVDPQTLQKQQELFIPTWLEEALESKQATDE